MGARDSGILRVAINAAYASAAVAAVGVVFLLLMYAGFLTPAKGLLVFGPLNDVCVLLQYALALPLVVVFHRLPARAAPGLRIVALACGVTGALGAVVFQALLLAGVIPFREQLAYAAASVLLVGVWILIASHIGRRSSGGGPSLRLSILAALYFGYPIWAYRVARQLEVQRAAPASA